MKEHYGLDDAAYQALQKQGVTDLELFRMVKLFDPNETGANLKSKISLFAYIDKKGDWSKPPTKLKHKLVAKAIFDSLEIKAEEKLQILEYLEDYG